LFAENAMRSAVLNRIEIFQRSVKKLVKKSVKTAYLKSLFATAEKMSHHNER